MVKCLGYRNGTKCNRKNTEPRGSSWKDYQLCSKCSKSDKTIQYRQRMDMELKIII